MTKVRSGGFGTTLILALLLVIVSVAAGAALAYLIWNPTEPDEPAVVQGIHPLNDLATVKYTTQVLVTEEENPEIFRGVHLPEWLTGEKLLLVAVGEVDAEVDLGQLGPEDVRVIGDTIYINLPEARILDSSLVEDKTRLYDRDRGLFRIRGNDEQIEEARRDAEDRIVEAARDNDILDKGQDNAETSISSLVTSLGYNEIRFT
jgi:Protein of unknown function (DUF4230)